MKPIEYQVDMEFVRALKCVEFRVPDRSTFKGDGFLLSLALRYGLIGAATTYHLVVSAHEDDLLDVIWAAQSWPEIVEQHCRFELKHRLPSGDERDLPAFMASWVREVLRPVPGYQANISLEMCLERTAQEFITAKAPQIVQPWKWWRRKSALRTFQDEARKSVHFALNFADRQAADLEEVKEIALLGE